MHHFLTDQMSGGSVALDTNDSRHIQKVLRLISGDEISVAVVGKGRYRCRLDVVATKQVTAIILDEIVAPKWSGPVITLLQAVPKGRKMDDVIRMVAELGVARVVPVMTRRCETKIRDGSAKRERWQGVAVAAAKQSKGVTVTKVDEPQSLTDAAIIDADLKIVFWEEESQSLKSVLSVSRPPSSVALFIGPEGGFTSDEITELGVASFVSASLGPKILRTETAPVVAVAQVLYAVGY